MIQRQQTLWLLLSVISGILGYVLPFYTGTRVAAEKVMAASLNAGSTFFLLVVNGIAVLLGMIAIFLYRDRKAQFRLCLAAAFTSALVILLFFVETRRFGSGSVSLSAIFTFAMLLGYILAARGVRKDEKLIKSLDKLR
ncbi:MAG TPA: DUF4293 family protein [Chitinophagaceae bacterium]|nr:DUF4293 family protein [Chitinophagaceae bacterium]